MKLPLHNKLAFKLFIKDTSFDLATGPYIMYAAFYLICGTNRDKNRNQTLGKKQPEIHIMIVKHEITFNVSHDTCFMSYDCVNSSFSQ